MQEIHTIKVEELNNNNIEQIQALYEDFKVKSTTDYKFDIPPLEYEDFKNIATQDVLKGFVLFEDSEPKGFLLYVLEQHKAIELNIIFVPDNDNQKRTVLLKAFLDCIKDKDDWNVVSYPMLGIQESFTRDISLLGFKLIGQAIVKFKFDNIISYQILKNLTLPELPEGYRIATWQNEYFEQASQAIHDTFKTATDTNFDPRFLTLEGSKDVVNKIVSNIFGFFLPECTAVIIHNDELIGVCFADITDVLTANIPLIGVKQAHKNKGFGKYLLKNSVASIIESIQQGKIYATEVNAAVETDNFAALRMYRKIGFKEDYTYPHAYLKNPKFID
ncbi:MAG: hypothetical protein A2287_03315 [Candidatus Melainabacteria bacterium RIFOXYA12_FULL_32_12]|nr:MAG: hypothetical protein A2287_03315 [Candidatus Melainabacteria bacterium RIFOXYA12_FULL_32_12]